MQISGFHNLNNNFNHIDNNKKSSTSTLSKIAEAKEIQIEQNASKSIVQSLSSQISSLSQGVNNANDGIAILQIADGVLSNLSQDLKSLTQLGTKANNDALGAQQKEMIQTQSKNLTQTMEQSIDNASFNGKSIFGSNFSILAGLSSVEINLKAPQTDTIDALKPSSLDAFGAELSDISLEIGSAMSALSNSIGSTLETINDLSNSKESIADSSLDLKMSDLQNSEIKLDASILSSIHSQESLQRSVATLLEQS